MPCLGKRGVYEPTPWCWHMIIIASRGGRPIPIYIYLQVIIVSRTPMKSGGSTYAVKRFMIPPFGGMGV